VPLCLRVVFLVAMVCYNAHLSPFPPTVTFFYSGDNLWFLSVLCLELNCGAGYSATCSRTSTLQSLGETACYERRNWWIEDACRVNKMIYGNDPTSGPSDPGMTSFFPCTMPLTSRDMWPSSSEPERLFGGLRNVFQDMSPVLVVPFSCIWT